MSDEPRPDDHRPDELSAEEALLEDGPARRDDGRLATDDHFVNAEMRGRVGDAGNNDGVRPESDPDPT